MTTFEKTLEGRLEGTDIEFEIDLAFDSTTFVYGVYKEFGPSWNLVGLVGFGAADSVDVMVGYRF